jgi:hypothetical protein
MTYNLVKLIGVFVLAAFLVVAIGLDWISESVGWGGVGILIGYIVGNASVTSREGTFSPIIER